MSKFVKLSALLCLLISCTIILSACDLSHKHYTDDFGVCKSCGKDTAELMHSNTNSEFISSEKYGRENNFVYFKFVSLGEDSITIIVDEVSAKVSYIEFCTKTSNHLYLRHVSSENSYFYESPLNEGETYYIRVRLLKEGNIKVRVSPYIEG